MIYVLTYIANVPLRIHIQSRHDIGQKNDIKLLGNKARDGRFALPVSNVA